MAVDGMWFFIQCEDAAAALRWAERVVASMSGQAVSPEALGDELARIDSWGPPLAAVAATLRAGLVASGPLAPVAAGASGGQPYRKFSGRYGELLAPSDPAVDDILAAAQAALQAKQPDGRGPCWTAFPRREHCRSSRAEWRSLCSRKHARLA